MSKKKLFFVFALLVTELQGTVRHPYAHETKVFMQDMVKSVLLLYKNLISWDSYKVIVATIPPFVAGAMLQDHVQNCFYDRTVHKNRCQMDSFFEGFARYGILFPVFYGIATGVAAHDAELRYTSQQFLLGLPFVMWTSDLIKKLRIGGHCAYRPWHEKFSCKKRAHGGFPSGHVALATYGATLYGLRFGAPYIVTLGGLAALTAVSFVNCNRHYLSQVIAGAGLGVLFGYAANKVVDERLHWLQERSVNIGFDTTSCGKPAIHLSYRF